MLKIYHCKLKLPPAISITELYHIIRQITICFRLSPMYLSISALHSSYNSGCLIFEFPVVFLLQRLNRMVSVLSVGILHTFGAILIENN